MAGIDQLVNTTADLYRNNPQGLQQRYAASQQLIDLLALQRLKSEKEAAAREIQMQMQQNPATIKQQREQELAQLTKQEMIQRVAPTLQRKLAQQQAAMQNPQPAPQGGGIASLQAPAQEQPYARGGIVQAYAGGGEVKRYAEGETVESDTPELTAEQLELVQRMRAEGRSEEEIQAALAETQPVGMGGILGGIKKALESETGRRIGAGVLSTAAAVPTYFPRKLAEGLVGEEYAQEMLGDPLYEQVYESMMRGEAPAPSAPEPSMTTAVPAPTPAQPQPQAPAGPDRAKLDDFVTSTETTVRQGMPAEAPDYAQYEESMRALQDIEAPEVNLDEVLSDAGKIAGFYGIGDTTVQDAEAERDKTLEYYKEKLGADETLSEKEAVAKRRKQLYEESQGRSTLGIIADFLLGFAGATNIAYGIAGGAMNLERSLRNAQAREDQALAAYEAALDDVSATRNEIMTAAVNAADAAYQKTLNQMIAEQQMKQSVFSSVARSRNEAANRELEANIAKAEREQRILTEGFRGKLQRYIAEVKAAAKRGSPEEAAAKLIEMLTSVQTVKQAALERETSSLEYQAQLAIASDKNSTEQQRKNAEEKMARMVAVAGGTNIMAMIDALVLDTFRSVGFGEPSFDDGWGDAASDNEQPSDKLLRMGQ